MTGCERETKRLWVPSGLFCLLSFLSLRSILTAYQNFLSCFFVFVVCRICTSKRSFGYVLPVLLDLARCVFVEVFVCDWPKTKIWLESFWRPQISQNIHVLGDPKTFTKTLQCCWSCLELAMPLGLSKFQIYFTILEIIYLRRLYLQHLPIIV